jgi:Ca-activated chloride channel family protein
VSIDAPLVLLVAPLVGAVVWAGAAWARAVRVRSAARWSDETARLAQRARGGGASVALAAVLATVALAGPRWGAERVITETRGLNLVLAVDISRSMLAEDVSPSRLERALREARRLVQDLAGDRIGLLAFAGASYVLAPLSVDESALLLYLDALDPDVASEGGTALAAALGRGAELLRATPDLADRVLVVFTDGEAHDSLAGVVAAAERLRDLGIHLVLVAQGGRGAARIPVRDARGARAGFQQDDAGWTIETRRRDDVLRAAADAGHGTIVAAELPDQAGAVRDLVAAYKRSRSGTASGERGRSRAWIPLFLAVALLTAQAITRRTAALLTLALVVGAAAAAAAAAQTPPRHPRTAAEKAWDRGDTVAAAEAYAATLAGREAGDTAWFNAGSAALASGRAEAARAALARAAASVDPGLRFAALYNLGVLGLRLAATDSANRETHLAEAERAARESLLLRPGDRDAKWNLELARRRRPGGAGGPDERPAGGGGGGAPAPPDEPPDRSGQNGAAPEGGLTQAQADAVLRSVAQAELDTRRERTARTRRAATSRVKDW